MMLRPVINSARQVWSTSDPADRATAAASLLPVTIALSALLGVLIVVTQRLIQGPAPYGREIVLWSVLALAAAGAVGFTRPERIALPACLSADGFVAYVLAIEFGVLLLPGVAFLAVWRTRYDALGGWTYPFLNKRWLVGLYGLSVVTFLVLPSLVRRGLTWARGAGEPSAQGHAVRAPLLRHPLQTAVGLVAALLITWFFAGPPWHIERHHRPIDFHEQVHLGQLQAIDKGYLPYIGPASTQYGAGSQVLTYAWMKVTGRFDIVGFRQANVLFHLVTFGAVAIVAYLTCGFAAMLLIVFLGVAYSPLSLFGSGADGTIVGAYGWGNGLRYLGSLIVVPLLARLVSRPGGRIRVAAAALGVVWGLFAWISQENSGTILIAASLLLTILWATASIQARVALAAAVNLLLGFFAVCAVVLAYYAWHGAAGQFVTNYFLVARAVAMGFQNTWWPAGESPGHLHAYYYTPIALIGIGLATLTDLRTLTLRQHLDPARVRLLAFVSVLLACYQTALLRSDYVHLMNTMLALPFVIVLAVRDLPGFVATTWTARAAVRAVLIAGALWMYPIGPVLANPWASVVTMPLVRLHPAALTTVLAKDRRVVFRRATPDLTDEPAVAPGMPPMRTFLEAGTELRDLIGTRRTFVDGRVAGGFSGLYYFLLDLTPGPILFEKETMVINNAIADEAFEHFKRHAGEFECILTDSLGTREVQAFRAAHPDAQILERTVGARRFYVVLTPDRPRA